MIIFFLFFFLVIIFLKKKNITFKSQLESTKEHNDEMNKKTRGLNIRSRVTSRPGRGTRLNQAPATRRVQIPISTRGPFRS